MKRNAVLALVTLLSLAAMPVRAQDAAPPDEDIKASVLRDACSPTTTLAAGAKAAADQICQSYLRGLADGLFLLSAIQDNTQVCLPKDGPISTPEAKSEFQDYLAAHPDTAEHAAGLVVVFGILAAHPCE